MLIYCNAMISNLGLLIRCLVECSLFFFWICIYFFVLFCVVFLFFFGNIRISEFNYRFCSFIVGINLQFLLYRLFGFQQKHIMSAWTKASVKDHGPFSRLHLLKFRLIWWFYHLMYIYMLSMVENTLACFQKRILKLGGWNKLYMKLTFPAVTCWIELWA